MCVVCFLMVVVAGLVLMLSYQRKYKQGPLQHILSMAQEDEVQSQLPSQEQQAAGFIIGSTKQRSPDVMGVHSEREASPLSVEELTEELTRRRSHTSSNRVVVYDQPCAPVGVGACVGANCQHPLSYSSRETVERLTQSAELTLTDEQRAAVAALGKDIPDSDLIIASAVSSNHFDEMQGMFESLHTKVYPLLARRIAETQKDSNLLQQQNKVPLQSFTVALFDIGLTEAERVRTEKNCRCKVVKFRKELFPAFVAENNCYSWKPLIMLAASQHAQKVIVWQDSSVRWFDSFLDNLDRTYNAGHQVLRYINSHRIPANTLKETFDYIHEDACGYLPYPEVQGNLHMHRADKFNQQVLFTPWARCALEKQCMCPRPPPSVLACSSGTLHRCHRFDQSAMGILLSRIYQNDLYKFMFQEFEFEREKGFRVNRGSVNRNYFKP